jgi:hypothetical protein
VPTLAQQPIDVQFFAILASAGTIYTAGTPALNAAVALSAANGNAVVQVCRVREEVIAPTAAATSNVRPSIGSGLEAVQLASAATVYPLEAARIAAYALSAANSGAPVYICRVKYTLTAP